MSAEAVNPNVLCVGRLYCDVIFTDLPRMPTAGTEVFAGGVGLHAGGGAAITAGHFATLGHRTSLAAQRPADGFDCVLRELSDLGVNLKLCRTASAAPQLTVAMVQGGDRAFVTHRAGPAYAKFSAEDAALMDIAHIHIGEATTLLENPELVTIAEAIGATLSLDCSWDDDLDVSRLGRLLPDIDVFLPNETESEFLRAGGVSEHAAKLTVVKQGAAGATAHTRTGSTHAPARQAKVVDTTGAGDAFNAAFLSAWLQKRPLDVCLAAGNTQGAQAVAHRGGLGGLATAQVVHQVAE